MGYELHHGNAFEVMQEFEENSVHAVVTDPPYGVVEFETANVEKMRDGSGGVWRIPPELDGSKRKPLPRFTVLSEDDKGKLRDFFRSFGETVNDVLRPGGHVFVATTQLLMHEVSKQLDEAGLERRDVLVRETKTLRGGDRPKGAHEEYEMVSSMPRVWWEPWLVYRKPLEGRLRDNLAEWETGGLRRESAERPFTDPLEDGKTPKEERKIVADAHPEGGDAHPSLKPQYLMRELCHAALPLQKAAADALGYDCAGIEIDETFYEMAEEAVPKLSEVETEVENRDDFGSSARGRSQSLSDFS
ncbi:MAG: hypothetical protein ACLFR5_06570 [Halobacteriales archaeon]